ncbi:CoA pyrophosphatase [Pigmentibacter sp. JX0631]|uniref:NUDIX hydrolase n=1 Tax=Pigmentibacter sp. JX0631 TaxID=2976982 RepID=UPI002468ACFA|nr:CoA pyrophosphatase [Pigmentibacter sp. JX0631]WGL61177.1 CoA pyrophosphatase [Pigmentibacter sp. JX0631]
MTKKILKVFKKLEEMNGLDEYVPDLARRSAILLPILCPEKDFTEDLVKVGDWQLVFTIRASHLKEHAGEVSFPGGRIDAFESPLDTALREAYEEIGIKKTDIKASIKLNHSFARSGYHIEPFCALLLDKQDFIHNESEVSHVICLSIEKLLQIKCWTEERAIMNFTRKVWHYPIKIEEIGEIDIWGATGNILHDFLLRVKNLT